MREIDFSYGRYFTFQWHLTTDCLYNCRHCYLDDPETRNLEKNPLPEAEIFRVVDTFDKFYTQLESRYGGPFRRNVVLTGGDPLLHPSFSKLAGTLTSRGYHIGILDCPDTVTPQVVRLLERARVSSIQFSLDGLEATHDGFRRSTGSFQRTLRKTLELQDSFRVHLMFTVCRENMAELIPLVRRLDKEGVQNFDFARVSYLGHAADMELIEPLHYRSLLESILRIEGELKQLRIGRKDNLWKLLYYEKGLLEIPRKSPKSSKSLKKPKGLSSAKRVTSGCPCGFVSLTILSDGSIFICRRFSCRIGHILKDDLFELYTMNRTLTKFRNPRSYEGCSICRLRHICRGCPAVGSSYYKEMYRRDPGCWRIVMPRRDVARPTPLDTARHVMFDKRWGSI